MKIPAAVFWVVLVLALLELRSEVKLLAQHFTWTGCFMPWCTTSWPA